MKKLLKLLEQYAELTGKERCCFYYKIHGDFSGYFFETVFDESGSSEKEVLCFDNKKEAIEKIVN